MNPATIALISSSLTELIRIAYRVAELHTEAQAGRLTEEAALQRLADVQAAYEAERQKMDQAIAAARARG